MFYNTEVTRNNTIKVSNLKAYWFRSHSYYIMLFNMLHSNDEFKRDTKKYVMFSYLTTGHAHPMNSLPDIFVA